MKTHKTSLHFDRDLTVDEQELVSLLGWEAGLALGVPVTIERQEGTDDGWRRKMQKPSKPVKVEPWKHHHADAAEFEGRVALELDHLMFYGGPRVADVVQVECGIKAWREEDRRLMAWRRFSLPMWKRVVFWKRWGHFVGRTIRDIPVVVVPDGGKPVLRPRWPETNRLVQGG